MTAKRPVIIAVMSGKGGVGKTTCCLGTALALTELGVPTAILDLDLENPSLGTACGLTRADLGLADLLMVPPRWHGIAIMSLSLLPMEDFADAPTLVNEERKHEMIAQMFKEVDWGDTQVILADLPPGSGEEARGLLTLNPDACLVVTAPQGISEMAVRRLINMAEEYAIRPLGLIQNNINNMPGRGKRSDPESRPEWAGARLAERFNLPILGNIPWSPRILEGVETHQPFEASHFKRAARAIRKEFLVEAVNPREVPSRDCHRTPPDPAEAILRDGSEPGQPVGDLPADTQPDPPGGPPERAGEGVTAQA